jgi:large subunit ribosomal protein L21
MRVKIWLPELRLVALSPPPQTGPVAFGGMADVGFILQQTQFMAYAIIKTGGKQYKVSVGDKLDVEKLEVAEGEDATFDQVLAAGEGADIKIGAPTVSGASVVATVVKQFKAPKVTAFKFKKRKGYHKTKGHRQPLTRVQVTAINA